MVAAHRLRGRTFAIPKSPSHEETRRSCGSVLAAGLRGGRMTVFRKGSNPVRQPYQNPCRPILAVLIVLSAAGSAMGSDHEDASRSATYLPASPDFRDVLDLPRVGSPRISPDGSAIAFTKSKADWESRLRQRPKVVGHRVHGPTARDRRLTPDNAVYLPYPEEAS
jgi:hypothetical protein